MERDGTSVFSDKMEAGNLKWLHIDVSDLVFHLVFHTMTDRFMVVLNSGEGGGDSDETGGGRVRSECLPPVLGIGKGSQGGIQ